MYFNTCDHIPMTSVKFTCCQLKCKPSAMYSLSLKSRKNSQPKDLERNTRKNNIAQMMTV